MLMSKKSQEEWSRRHKQFYDLLLEKNEIIDVVGKGVNGTSDLWDGIADGFIVGSFDDASSLCDFLMSFHNNRVALDDIQISINKPVGGPMGFCVNRMRGLSHEWALSFVTDRDYETSFIDIRMDIVSYKDRWINKEKESYWYCDRKLSLICSFLQMIGFTNPIIISTPDGTNGLFPVNQFLRQHPCEADIQNFLLILSKWFDTSTFKIEDDKYQRDSMLSIIGAFPRRKRRRYIGRLLAYKELPMFLGSGLAYNVFRERLAVLNNSVLNNELNADPLDVKRRFR